MADGLSTTSVRRPALAALLGCLALAGLLRFPGLGTQSLWIDELFSLDASSWPLHTIFTVADGQPPLEPLLLKLVRLLFPFDVTGRALAATAGTLSVGLLLVLGTRLWDERTGLLAALLLAISPLHVWYSREGRPYALVALWSIVSVLCLEAIVRGEGRRAVVGYAFATFCGLMTHYSYAAIVVAQLIFLGLHRRREWRRAFLVATGAGAVAVALTLPAALTDLGGQIGVSRAFTWLAVPYAALTFVGGFGVGPSLEELHLNGSLAALAQYRFEVVAVIVTGAGLTLAGLRALRTAGPWGTYLVVLLVVPPTLGLAAARVMGVAFNPRYIVGALPSFELLLALGLVRHRRAFTTAGLCALVATALLSIGRDRFDPRYARDDLRGTAHYLESVLVPEDAVVVCAADVASALPHYYRGDVRLGRFSARAFESAAGAAAELGQLAGSGHTTWLVLSREWEDDPQGFLRQQVEAMHLTPAASLSGVRIYRLGT
jgi:hypothetical protein